MRFCIVLTYRGDSYVKFSITTTIMCVLPVCVMINIHLTFISCKLSCIQLSNARLRLDPHMNFHFHLYVLLF